jgi:methionyl-tRNA formyltransferase
MVKEMDAGAIIHQVEEPILSDETASELSIRLSELGAEALVEALALLSEGAATEREQDHAAATFAPKIDRETARIDWSLPALEISRHVRAMDDVPGAWSILAGEPLKLFKPRVESWAGARSAPGSVLAVDGGLLVSAGRGAVGFAEVQPAGGRRMNMADWLRGHHVETGSRLE